MDKNKLNKLSDLGLVGCIGKSNFDSSHNINFEIIEEKMQKDCCGGTCQAYDVEEIIERVATNEFLLIHEHIEAMRVALHGIEEKLSNLDLDRLDQIDRKIEAVFNFLSLEND